MQNFLVNRYAELNCNDSEVRIKSLTITQLRQDTGGTWSVTFNVSDDVITQLTTMISAYTSLASGTKMYFEVWSPYLAKAFFVIAQPPKHIPMPDVSQNELQTVEMTFTIEEYLGMDTAVEPKVGA